MMVIIVIPGYDAKLRRPEADPTPLTPPRRPEMSSVDRRLSRSRISGPRTCPTWPTPLGQHKRDLPASEGGRPVAGPTDPYLAEPSDARAMRHNRIGRQDGPSPTVTLGQDAPLSASPTRLV